MAKWQKGQSGNPKGRKKGGKTQSTIIRQQLESHSDEIINKVVEIALRGNLNAIKLCLERICPPLKQAEVSFEFGNIGGKSLTEKGEVIINSLAEGNITAHEARNAISILLTQGRLKEIDELENRLSSLEEALNDRY